MSSPPRIAISLGASFMGYATHAGFMARLHALGVRPVAVSGSSAGAITAGLYAAGLEQETIRQAVLSPRLYLSFARRTRWLWHQIVSSFMHRHPGVFDPRGAVTYFESLVGTRSIESLSNPQLLIAHATKRSSSARDHSPPPWQPAPACRCFFHHWSSRVSCVMTVVSRMNHQWTPGSRMMASTTSSFTASISRRQSRCDCPFSAR